MKSQFFVAVSKTPNIFDFDHFFTDPLVPLWDPRGHISASKIFNPTGTESGVLSSYRRRRRRRRRKKKKNNNNNKKKRKNKKQHHKKKRLLGREDGRK